MSAPQARGARWTVRGTSEGSARLERAEAAREARSSAPQARGARWTVREAL
jgi:hypothetical protein